MTNIDTHAKGAAVIIQQDAILQNSQSTVLQTKLQNTTSQSANLQNSTHQNKVSQSAILENAISSLVTSIAFASCVFFLQHKNDINQKCAQESAQERAKKYPIGSYCPLPGPSILVDALNSLFNPHHNHNPRRNRW